MLILSQNKRVLVNTNEIFIKELSDVTVKDKYGIYYYGSDRKVKLLGSYKTDKDVEIVLNNIYLSTTFKMPSDEDVVEILEERL